MLHNLGVKAWLVRLLGAGKNTGTIALQILDCELAVEENLPEREHDHISRARLIERHLIGSDKMRFA